MGYRVHREEDTTFKVVEVSAGNVRDIFTKTTEEKAKDISKSLNFGAGFDGKIPEFFLQRFEVAV